jgi:general secretion pathway protein B
MSFILDALKKSEVERQRQSTPGLIDARVIARRRGLPTWAIVVGALLIVNLVVLAAVLLHQRAPSVTARGAAPAADAAAGGGAAPNAAGTTRDHFSPMDAAPTYAPEIDVPQNTPPPAPPAARSSEVRPADVPRLAARPATRRADPLLSDPDGQANDEALPTIDQVHLTGPQALPEIHLDVHVYGTKPGDRFIFVNGRKYHEGATLEEGPVVERIRRDGAVLNYRGLRFLLPR